jgi:hypothetical protein
MSLQPRYSLLALFIVITLCSVIVAITLAHGAFGLLLLVPHIVVTIGITLLLRRKWRAFAAILGTVYCSFWVSTAIFGIPQMREEVRHIVKGRRDLPPVDGEEWRQLTFDPMLSEPYVSVSPPWLFIGNESAPCPFVVVVDYGCMAAPTLGTGERAYFLWLFGYDIKIWHQFLWLS